MELKVVYQKSKVNKNKFRLNLEILMFDLQKQSLEVFSKKGFLKNFTGKHLYWSLSLKTLLKTDST